MPALKSYIAINILHTKAYIVPLNYGSIGTKIYINIFDLLYFYF